MSSTAITHDALIAAGYRHHKRQAPGQWLNHAGALYQKRVRGGDDTLFYINLFWYDHRPYGQDEAPDGWLPEVQFNGGSDQRPTFDVTLLPDGMAVEDVEAFFLRIYRLMGCEPYEPAPAPAAPND